MRRNRRRLVVIAGALAVALVIAGVTVFALRPSAPSGPRAASGPKINAAGSVLAGATATAPMPTTAGLTAALAGPLKQANLGSHVSVEVADMATGKLLYGQDATSPTTPASTMKLATTLAVLATRGPNYRITTNVVAGPEPGEVVLVGAGDPTLAAAPTRPTPSPAVHGSARHPGEEVARRRQADEGHPRHSLYTGSPDRPAAGRRDRHAQPRT